MAKNGSKDPVGEIGKSIGELTRSLNRIANSLGFVIVNSEELRDKKKTDKMVILDRLGYDRNEIAAIVDSTPDAVSSRLSEARKEGRKA